jgi:hypothetical protein
VFTSVLNQALGERQTSTGTECILDIIIFYVK